MNTLLYMTLGGSALALLLLALRYLVFRRMPSTVYYYAWLLVLLRFALPLPGLVPTETRQSAAPAAAPPRMRAAVVSQHSKIARPASRRASAPGIGCSRHTLPLKPASSLRRSMK